MDKRELKLRFLLELDMLKTMLPFYIDDEDATNLMLDRINEIKRFIAEIDKELNNENN
jgi:hypothetical protein